jgi:serine/threonine protein kinase
MGTVFEGVNVDTEQPAAIKVLNPHLAAEEGFRQRFEIEIETLKKLKHANIVRLYGFGEQDGHVYYAMELVHGQSMEDELQAGRRFDWRETTRLSIKLTRALKHAHDHGVIHRDLKPANLLLTTEGDIKLADFGIARLFGNTRLTSTGGPIGTAEYMAPEQGDGRGVTPHCDLYSLGGVMFAMLAGRPPFRGGSLLELLEHHRYSEAPPVTRFAPDVPQELAEIIARLLSKEPVDRGANALVLARQLAAMEHGLSLVHEIGNRPGGAASDPLQSNASQKDQPLPISKPQGNAGPRSAPELIRNIIPTPTSTAATELGDPAANLGAAVSGNAFPSGGAVGRNVAGDVSALARANVGLHADPLGATGQFEPTSPDVSPPSQSRPKSAKSDPGAPDSATAQSATRPSSGSSWAPAPPERPKSDPSPRKSPPDGPAQRRPVPGVIQPPAPSAGKFTTAPRRSANAGQTDSDSFSAAAAGVDRRGEPESRSAASPGSTSPDPGAVKSPPQQPDSSVPGPHGSQVHSVLSLLNAPLPSAGAETANRFVTVEEDERRRAAEDRDDASVAQRAIQIAALVAGLVCLVALGWYLMRPPSADRLYARVEVAAATGQPERLVDAGEDIQDFLNRFPSDPRAAKLKEYAEEVELTRLERRVHLDSRLALGNSAMSPIQRDYQEAIGLAATEPERAAAKLQAVIDLYSQAAEPSLPTARFLELARRQLVRLQREVGEQAQQSLAMLDAGLKQAAQLRLSDSAAARGIWSGIIELYGDKPWAATRVAQAKAALAESAGAAPR